MTFQLKGPKIQSFFCCFFSPQWLFGSVWRWYSQQLVQRCWIGREIRRKYILCYCMSDHSGSRWHGFLKCCMWTRMCFPVFAWGAVRERGEEWVAHAVYFIVSSAKTTGWPSMMINMIMTRQWFHIQTRDVPDSIENLLVITAAVSFVSSLLSGNLLHSDEAFWCFFFFFFFSFPFIYNKLFFMLPKHTVILQNTGLCWVPTSF